MHPEKVDSAWRPELSEMVVRLVRSDEQRRYQQLMRAHHYLGYLPKIGETLWYVATWREQWLALLSFSGSALKCAVRDRWIGWTLRQHYGRLKLVVNNSRFLILPDGHLFNLGSRVLSLCQRRLPGDWEEAFGHGVVLLETFVDPQRHRGTVYRAANWMYVGHKGGAIVCPWCWGSPRGPWCAGCAVTRPSRIGRKAWGRNRESALAAVAKRVVMSCPASTSCAMC